MFDLFGWFRRKVAEAFTGGIADGLKAAGIATDDMPAELQAMQQKAAALVAKEDEPEAEPRKGRAK